MEFKRDEPVKVRFTIPDRPTVRQQMAYYSEASGTIRPHLERLWLGTRAIILEWECDLFKHDVNLDEVDNPEIMSIMLWAAIQVRDHLNKMSEVPKNS